ncbi:NADH dehydrogenase subunit 2 (mitochondrion) [Lacerta agilis]|uniref:NADH-ubiquinone oxidoreductase chain 2 n=1 Tax=Lacerta agilis TaxID=80427 RepID=S5FMD0_LACAG|nr:NADH dehydrogenase subunit 2 [Lacerta agilis]AGQ46005.1 NADH dehydrogenase subunit 2 [Lacerta agilis]
MNPIISSMFISNLALGTIIVAASYHWFLAWVGLELNTLAIIPMLAKQHHPRATEAATKYFIIQATASSIILLSSVINAWHTGTWDITQLTSHPTPTLLTIALAMKLGLAPMHFWLPEVMQGINTSTALIMTTWQKLPPMTLLYLTTHQLPTMVVLLLAVLSVLIGGWSAKSQTQMRKIMAYSSIAHLGWMLTALSLSQNLLLFTLFIYILMTSSMFLVLISSMSKTSKDLGQLWSTSPAITSISMITLISLGGLPPLIGFLPKWLILSELTNNHLTSMAVILALSSLLSLMFYMRLTYTTTLTISPNTTNSMMKWRFKLTKPLNMVPMITSLLTLSPLLPLISP